MAEGLVGLVRQETIAQKLKLKWVKIGKNKIESTWWQNIKKICGVGDNKISLIVILTGS